MLTIARRGWTDGDCGIRNINYLENLVRVIQRFTPPSVQSRADKIINFNFKWWNTLGTNFGIFTPVLISLHWLKIEQCTQYKVASITYKVLQSEQPFYLHSLLNVQSNRTTHSSDIITLQRPSVRSHLKVTDRSFTHHAPVLWNSLPKQLRQPLAPPSFGTVTDFAPPLTMSSHQFHSKLKTFLFEQSLPP